MDMFLNLEKRVLFFVHQNYCITFTLPSHNQLAADITEKYAIRDPFT